MSKNRKMVNKTRRGVKLRGITPTLTPISRVAPDYFLFCLPKRNCPHFPAFNWLIRAVFTGRGWNERNGEVQIVKTAWINKLQAGKCWHFLFCEQNKRWQHSGLHHSVPHITKPPSCENGTDQSIYGRKMPTLPVSPVLTVVGSAPLPFSPEKGITQTHRHQFCIVYND